MKNKKEIKLNFFEIASLFWMSFALVMIALSFLKLFNIYLIISSIIVLTVSFFYFLKKGNFKIEKLSGSFKSLFLLILSFGILLSIFTTPTIFGGRDEGAYSNSAIMLANDGQYSHDSKLIKNFYDIYGKSKALNFPGFQYDSKEKLESQFLPGYPTWIAISYQFFGLNGIKFTNLIPFLTLILSFYLIIVEVFPLIKNSAEDTRECLNGNILKKCWPKLNQAEQFGWLGVIFLVSFMPLIIFYKFTLSEIYFASLAWFSLYLLIRYLKNKHYSSFKIIFIPLFLMLFVRIETLAIIFSLLLIMIGKDFNHLRQARYQFFFALSCAIFFFVVWLEPNFFINAVEGISEISGLNANAMPESREITFWGRILPDDWKNLYDFKIWFNYQLLPFFVMAGTFLLLFFKSVLSNMKFGNKKAQIIIPFIFFSPTFIYLIDANISLDHPWMLRRLIFSIIPILFFYSAFFLFYLRQKNRFLFRLIVIFAILGNISLFATYSNAAPANWTNFINFSQNKTLLEQTEKLSKLFNENDLILLSQKSSGSGWSLISEPMRNIFNRQAVYFFNSKDYAELNHNDFDNIYLITTEGEEFLYENIPKEKIAEWSIKNTIIDPSRDPYEKPHSLETLTKVNIYKINKR